MLEPQPRTILMTADTIGGVWTYAVELARHLGPHHVSIALATMGDPLSKAQRTEAERIPNLHIFQSHFRLEWMPEPWEEVERAGEWLLTLEEQIRPDIVHLNGYVHGELPWRAPVLMVGHSCVLSWWQAVKGEPAPPTWSEYRDRVRRGLGSAQLVAAPTAAMLHALSQHYGPLPATRVIPNGRDTDLFRPERKQPFIFAAGRLGDEAKNIRTLGDAAAGLKWEVFVAGAGRDASGRAPLPRNVRHCGQLAPEGVAQWMAAAAIYCLPARYEPFGLSVLEAALSGCALVLGDIPSLRELWDGAALFVPPNDVRALRRTLGFLIADPALRAAYSRTARARALRFTPGRTAQAYLGAYCELLASPPAFLPG